ncbi:MAG: alpha/beta hydrolase [Solirubrobacteraceae bacterium]|nr:alpha/beta hydrolase [Solirubrobacteraceae bacterium]
MRRASSPRDYRAGPLHGVWPSPARPASRRAARRADRGYGLPAEPSWRGIDWPAHTRRTAIRGGAVNYVDIGSGERAVVFVHGLGGCWQNWLETLPAVAAAGHRAVALDLPGFGCSDMPSEPITITRYALAVNELCHAIGLGSVALVGNSMGGFTAAETAIRHPDRVERLVLVDAAGISTALARTWISERVGKLLVSGSAGGSGRDPAAVRRMLTRPGWIHLAMGAVMRYPTLLRRDLLAEQLQSIGARGFLPALQAILDYDFTDRLGEIACPTLVVQGTQDVLVPLGDAREFERRIPRSTSVVLDDTGHVPMLERPAAFNRVLLDFLGS